jgi:MYXO-CTERM domain-containing protein
MRRLVLTSSLLASLSLISCAPPGAPTETDGRTAKTSEAIAYGTTDNVHTAVVALLADAGGGSFTECSGTIVQVKNGQGYILTAAHCCNAGAPSVVVQSNDYTVGEQYLGGGNPVAPVYSVVPGSVYYDSLYNQQTHDFCMLKAANMPANTPVIPVAQAGQDGLQIGVQLEHVGFGITDNNMNNSGRRHGTNTANQDVNANYVQYSQGGAQHIPGPCEGDSGGPALTPAGAAQGQQKVVAITSYGNSASCSQGSIGVSMRVSSQTGPNGFITNFLNDAPSGTQAGGVAPPDCNSCAQSAQNGACSAQTQACVNDNKCITLNNCLGACQTQACVTQCVNAAGQTAVNELNAVQSCICNTACVSECVVECGGSSSSSSSSSSSGGACGLQSGDATCDACIDGSCCGQAQDCVADSSCTNCLNAANPPPACNNDAAYVALFACLDSKCVAACGGSSSSSSSSSSTSSSSGSTTSSSNGGVGGGGVGGGGVGGGSGGNGSGTGSGSGSGNTTGSGAGGGNVGQSSGCSVGSTGGNTGTSLAALVLGLAFAATRRRRSA